MYLTPDKDDLGNFADRSAETFVPVTLIPVYFSGSWDFEVKPFSFIVDLLLLSTFNCCQCRENCEYIAISCRWGPARFTTFSSELRRHHKVALTLERGRGYPNRIWRLWWTWWSDVLIPQFYDAHLIDLVWFTSENEVWTLRRKRCPKRIWRRQRRRQQWWSAILIPRLRIRNFMINCSLCRVVRSVGKDRVVVEMVMGDDVGMDCWKQQLYSGSWPCVGAEICVVQNSELRCTTRRGGQGNASKAGPIHRQGPHLSIRIGIWILPLFGDDLNCICFDDPNRETAMLSTYTPSSSKWYHHHMDQAPPSS